MQYSGYTPSNWNMKQSESTSKPKQSGRIVNTPKETSSPERSAMPWTALLLTISICANIIQLLIASDQPVKFQRNPFWPGSSGGMCFGRTASKSSGNDSVAAVCICTIRQIPVDVSHIIQTQRLHHCIQDMSAGSEVMDDFDNIVRYRRKGLLQ